MAAQIIFLDQKKNLLLPGSPFTNYMTNKKVSDQELVLYEIKQRVQIKSRRGFEEGCGHVWPIQLKILI